MLAYIIFLFVSILYYVICLIFGFEFQEWQRIVVAATIASYAFSISSGYKFLARLNANLLEFSKERLELLKQLHTKKIAIFAEGDKDEPLNLNHPVIKNIVTSIEKREQLLQKNTKTAFWYDVVGYLLFFCVFAFRPIYEVIKSLQEGLTLLAFIMILLVEYVESTYAAKYEENYKEFNTQIKETIKQFEKHTEYISE